MRKGDLKKKVPEKEKSHQKRKKVTEKEKSFQKEQKLPCPSCHSIGNLMETFQVD
jgi:hypothetical protein